MKKPAHKPPAAPKTQPVAKRGAAKWDKPEPLHKEKFEQLLDDAIGAKKKAN